MRSPLRQTGSEAEIENLRHVFGATDADLDALADFYMTMVGLSDADIAALDEVGMADYMRPFGLPTGLASQIYATLNMLFVVPVDRLAASEGVLVLRNMVLGGAGRFHRGGYGQVAEACAAVRRGSRRRVPAEHAGARGRGRGRPGGGDRHRQGDDPGAGRRVQRRHPADRPGAGRA